jgi:deoxyribodipyrimidine photo-lyase
MQSGWKETRLQDNEAVFNATKNGIPTLLLYVFEKIIENDTHCKTLNRQTIYLDLNSNEKKSNTKILKFHLRWSSIQFSWRKL